MVKSIIELFNKTGDIQIIPAHTEHKPPAKPYATYTVIGAKTPDMFGATETIYDDKQNKYIEKTEYRAETRVQFDVYVKNQDEVLEKTTKLKEFILFIARNDLKRINVGIVKNTDTKMLKEDINSQIEYRGCFDIVFEYMNITDERKVEVAEAIELIVKEKKEYIEKIEEEKNGNL